ncbi:MAG: hypothetical protein IJX22_03105 [Opitutales bacterium]|nr:hypothetical protein [Opitutales bacterium]
MQATIVGIIIGSFFTIIGVITQGLVTYFLEGRKLREQAKVSEERALREKREIAYKKFMVFQAQLISAHSLHRESLKNPQLHTVLSSSAETNAGIGQILGNIINVLSETLSDISLYGNWDTAKRCAHFFRSLNESHTKPDEDFSALLNEYDAIVLKMREEIGITK